MRLKARPQFYRDAWFEQRFALWPRRVGNEHVPEGLAWLCWVHRKVEDRDSSELNDEGPWQWGKAPRYKTILEHGWWPGWKCVYFRMCGDCGMRFPVASDAWGCAPDGSRERLSCGEHPPVSVDLDALAKAEVQRP